MLLGKCKDNEVQYRVQEYADVGFPLDNIKVLPDNGGAVETYGYVHLGVPQGTANYQKSELQKIVSSFIKTCCCSDIIDEAQYKWVYLNNIIKNKVSFWLRHISPAITGFFVNEIDYFIKNRLDVILGNDTLTDEDYDGAFLPIKKYGLGLHHTRDVITAAYLSNFDETRDTVARLLPKSSSYLSAEFLETIGEHTIVESIWISNFVKGLKAIQTHLDTVIDTLHTAGQIDRAKTIESSEKIKKKKQKFYSSLISQCETLCYEFRVAESMDSYQKTRILAVEGDWAGAWLHSIPQDKASSMNNIEFRHAMHFRLGLSFQDRPHICICKANTIIDENLSHILTCHAFADEKFRRHEEIVSEFKKLGAAAHVSVSDRGLKVDEDGCQRPDLRFHRFGDNNKDLDIDVSITFSGSASYVKHRNVEAARGYVIDQMEKKKNLKYLAKCNANNIDFKPIVFDAFDPPLSSISYVLNILLFPLFNAPLESGSFVFDPPLSSISYVLNILL